MGRTRVFFPFGERTKPRGNAHPISRAQPRDLAGSSAQPTRYRKGIYDPPELLEPGEIFPYEIELLPTSNVFLAGHKIAVHVTSSSFPMYDRNPTTGQEQEMDTELRVAHQTVFHDAAHPSQVTLPVVRG